MPKLFSLGNQNFKSTANCSDISPVEANLFSDMPSACGTRPIDECQDIGRNKKWGYSGNCDPMQAGTIINDLSKDRNSNIIHRHTNSIRGCTEAMLDLFSDIVVKDPDNKAWAVPLMYGSQEKAVAYLLQNNVRKDNTLVVDQPTLPFMAITQTGLDRDMDRYCFHQNKIWFEKGNGIINDLTEIVNNDIIYGFSSGIPVNISYSLAVWTTYIEDMLQIVEQIIRKLTPMAYIWIKGVPWEVCVNLDGTEDNIDQEPGDQNIRVVKYVFNMTAKSYIAQPIERKRTVLKMTIDFQNSVERDKVTEIYRRLEIEAND